MHMTCSAPPADPAEGQGVACARPLPIRDYARAMRARVMRARGQGAVLPLWFGLIRVGLGGFWVGLRAGFSHREVSRTPY